MLSDLHILIFVAFFSILFVLFLDFSRIGALLIFRLNSSESIVLKI